MKPKSVGFFRELAYGVPDSPNLVESVRRFAAYPKELVLNYLRTAPAIGGAWTITQDVLDPAHPDIGPLILRSDGAWKWPEELAYYVERYNVDLPAEFLAHLEAVGYQPPPEEAGPAI